MIKFWVEIVFYGSVHITANVEIFGILWTFFI